MLLTRERPAPTWLVVSAPCRVRMQFERFMRTRIVLHEATPMNRRSRWGIVLSPSRAEDRCTPINSAVPRSSYESSSPLCWTRPGTAHGRLARDVKGESVPCQPKHRGPDGCLGSGRLSGWCVSARASNPTSAAAQGQRAGAQLAQLTPVRCSTSTIGVQWTCP